jgi:hypothetical protein
MHKNKSGIRCLGRIGKLIGPVATIEEGETLPVLRLNYFDDREGKSIEGGEE